MLRKKGDKMKISRLKIRNLFGIKEFDSDGKSVEITGKNGVGKSAVIDAIKYALTNKSDREYIILNGEVEGEVLIETDTGLKINRKPRLNKADYKSIKQEGERVEKTEAFLRDIYTPLQLNPVEFAEMDTNEQNRIILDLIDFKWDLNWIKEQFGEIPPNVNYQQNILRVLHDIQKDEGYYFTARQNVNRDSRNKTAFIQEIGSALPPNYDAAKWDEFNLGEIYARIETIRTKNTQIETARSMVQSRDNKIKSFQDALQIEKNAIYKRASENINKLGLEIKELETLIKDKINQIDREKTYDTNETVLAQKTYDANVAAFEGEVKQHESIASLGITPFADLQEEATNAEKMKKHINEYNRMMSLKKEVIDLEEESKGFTEKIEKARTLPGEILANSNIPVAGLTIKDGVPLINGLPVSNLSEGEKLGLCIDVTVAKEGALKMILIDGIERLSTEKREDVYERLRSKGVQFIATRTTDDELLEVVEL